MLNSPSDQWFEMVKARYGFEAVANLYVSGSSTSCKSSGWWKAICSIRKCHTQQHPNLVDWFSNRIKKEDGER